MPRFGLDFDSASRGVDGAVLVFLAVADPVGAAVAFLADPVGGGLENDIATGHRPARSGSPKAQ